MKKVSALLVILAFFFSFPSCKKDKGECVKVKFVSTYCPKFGAVVVNIEQNSGELNHIALLNVPQSYMVAGKIFYVAYHYDQALDKLDEANICPAIAYEEVKIFVADSISETDCKN